MSKVSPYVEHLIRAAVVSIKRQPENWDQRLWCRKKEDCGTSYCLGGWMLLFDGWSHTQAMPHGGSSWFKGELRIVDPFDEYLAFIVYGEENGSRVKLPMSIFSDDLRTFTDLIHRIEEDLEINFEEDCPCRYETLCNLGGCPCGTHSATVTNVIVEEVSDANPAIVTAINEFVKACLEDDDNISTGQVLRDVNMMALIRSVFQAGAQSTVDEVTSKANYRIAEINHELQALRAEVKVDDRSGQDLPSRERDIVLRKLQGQVDELRDGTRRTPEFRKMKAALKKAHEDVAAMQEGQKVRAAQIRKLQDQVVAQERIIKSGEGSTILKARREGFHKAVESWQKALDIIKAQENL